MNFQSKSATVAALTMVFLSVTGAAADTQRDGSINAETDPKTQPLIPTGQVARYVVTNMVSEPNKAATVVSITNNGPAACNVSVDWSLGSGSVVCTTNFASLPAGQTKNFCSRNPGSNFVTCGVTCSPALNFHEGRAQVASTNNANCAKIAVDARIFFFNGSDTTLGGAYGPKIVKKGLGNSGD